METETPKKAGCNPPPDCTTERSPTPLAAPHPVEEEEEEVEEEEEEEAEEECVSALQLVGG